MSEAVSDGSSCLLLNADVRILACWYRRSCLSDDVSFIGVSDLVTVSVVAALVDVAATVAAVSLANDCSYWLSRWAIQ